MPVRYRAQWPPSIWAAIVSPTHYFPHRGYSIIFIEGPKFEKLPLHPSHMLCTRPHSDRPNWETNEARGGVPAPGPVEVNRGPLMTSGLVRPHRAVVRCTDWAAIAFPSVRRFPHRRYLPAGDGLKSSVRTHRTSALHWSPQNGLTAGFGWLAQSGVSSGQARAITFQQCPCVTWPSVG
jgi:hypothetical protein